MSDCNTSGPTVYAMELEEQRSREAVPTLFDEPVDEESTFAL